MTQNYQPYYLNNDQNRLHFLTLNYELLAAVSWQGYLKEGRGCVAIDNSSHNQLLSKNPDKQPQWNLDTLLGFYIGENGSNFQDLLGGKWPDRETKLRVAQYDPNWKVLALVWFGGNNGDFLIQGISIPQLPPPLCYQRLLPRLKEFMISPGI